MGRDQARGGTTGPAGGGGALGRARGERWLPVPLVTAIDEAAAYTLLDLQHGRPAPA